MNIIFGNVYRAYPSKYLKVVRRRGISILIMGRRQCLGVTSECDQRERGREMWCVTSVCLVAQELTCREELLTLLLSLLPLVWKIPVQEEKAPGQYLQITSLC